MAIQAVGISAVQAVGDPQVVEGTIQVDEIQGLNTGLKMVYKGKKMDKIQGLN